MRKSRIIEIAFIIYLCLGMSMIYFLDFDRNNNHFVWSWVCLSVSAGFSYGYYALYRDLKLFGWKWIVHTFKQLINKSVDDE